MPQLFMITITNMPREQMKKGDAALRAAAALRRPPRRRRPPPQGRAADPFTGGALRDANRGAGSARRPPPQSK